VNAVVSSGILASLRIFPKAASYLAVLGPERKEFSMLIVIITTYALSAEIPGFLLNSVYDGGVLNCLSTLEEAVLLASVQPDTGTAKVREILASNSQYLRDVHLNTLLEHCLRRFEQIQNVDASLIHTLLTRIESVRETVGGRSKHPFPRLVEIMGLGSCAFLLGEILTILRSVK